MSLLRGRGWVSTRLAFIVGTTSREQMEEIGKWKWEPDCFGYWYLVVFLEKSHDLCVGVVVSYVFKEATRFCCTLK